MTITIQDLVNNPHLKTQVLAGNGGLNREVTWAHVCELSDPTPWLNGGELILTTGLAIPRLGQEQKAYIKRLIGAKVSGISIAGRMYAPEMINPLLSEADRNGFPVLLTAYEVPWITITRTVADANSHKEHARLLQTLRIYEVAREAFHNTPPSGIVNTLSKIINCSLYIINPVNRKPLFYEGKLPNNVKDILKGVRPFDTFDSPAIQRIEWRGIQALQVIIPTSRPAILLVFNHPTDIPDNIVLRHTATVVGLAIEKDTAIHERQRRLGAEIMEGLIDQRLTPDSANFLLANHGLRKEPRCIVACSAGTQPFEHEWLHLQLNAGNIPHLLTLRGNVLVALLPASAESISSLKSELQTTNICFGISNNFDCPSRVAEAYQEALWALRAAEVHNKRFMFYNEESPVSPFLPRSRSETKELVEQVIGDLLAYDKKHNSQLVMTLYIYLRENRSWKNASEKLHIHKQTLVYRINRIEEMTERRLNVTNNIAELWLALEAAMMLGLLPELS
jgi:PucR family transcriptional regulator, purine catabolism regulatory protein